MILPKNGRVIIIDDQPSQALPLISALSKYNIATTYFDARKETIPVTKFNDVRVVFLDINLNDGPSNWATEKSLLITFVSSIIEAKTPYILFVWSVNEKDQFADVVALFDAELKEYKPIVPPIKMEKYNIFKQVEVDESEKKIIKWELNYSYEETIELIKKKINDGIATIDSLEALLKWENVVNDSSALVVNDILALAGSQGNINDDLKQIYYNLAHAYWGKTLDAKSPNEIVAKSLVNLNAILNDKIEYKLFTDFKINLLNGFPPKPIMESLAKSQLNRRLLFSEDTISEPLPGNLYLLTNEEYKKNIIENLIDRSTFAVNYCEEKKIEKKDFYEGGEIKTDYKKTFSKFAFGMVEQVIKDAVYMELELTPVCDYSQDNRIFCRMISGVILEEKYRYKQKRSASYFYVSPLFLLDGKSVNFYCDFRYIKSVDIASMIGIKPKFRIRHLFQTDIQSQLARQVSRPGIVSL